MFCDIVFLLSSMLTSEYNKEPDNIKNIYKSLEFRQIVCYLYDIKAN